MTEDRLIALIHAWAQHAARQEKALQAFMDGHPDARKRTRLLLAQPRPPMPPADGGDV